MKSDQSVVESIRKVRPRIIRDEHRDRLAIDFNVASYALIGLARITDPPNQLKILVEPKIAFELLNISSSSDPKRNPRERPPVPFGPRARALSYAFRPSSNSAA